MATRAGYSRVLLGRAYSLGILRSRRSQLHSQALEKWKGLWARERDRVSARARVRESARERKRERGIWRPRRSQLNSQALESGKVSVYVCVRGVLCVICVFLEFIFVCFGHSFVYFWLFWGFICVCVRGLLSIHLFWVFFFPGVSLTILSYAIKMIV